MKRSVKMLLMNNHESMQPYMRGYRRYSDGRFAPRSEYGMNDYYDEKIHGGIYDTTRSTPTYYPEDVTRHNDKDYSLRPMNRIGFQESPNEYNDGYRMDEMAYRKGEGKMSGHGSMSGTPVFTKHTAEDWAKKMENEDGTHGPHWNTDQVKQIMAQKGINCDPAEFYAAINMIYSDYVKVAKKHGIGNSMDFYIDMAKAFLDDKDAGPDNIAKYYQYVVNG